MADLAHFFPPLPGSPARVRRPGLLLGLIALWAGIGKRPGRGLYASLSTEKLHSDQCLGEGTSLPRLASSE
jgi:hypothetical protein